MAAGAQRRLVIAANRGPVSFHSDPSGEPVVTRGPGGLVTVLTELLRTHPGTWVATALGEEEERLAEERRAVDVELDGDAYRVRYVGVERDVYHKYYNIIANPMLWFIQHYLWDLGRHPDISPNEVDAFWNGYMPVQRLFAEAISDELRAGGPVEALAMLHDYHLYGVAPLVRAARARRVPAPVRAHPLGAERRLAGAARDHAQRRVRRPARQRRRRLPHAALRGELPAGVPRPARPAGRRARARGAGREPQGVGAGLPGVHRPRPAGAGRRRTARGGGRSRSC